VDLDGAPILGEQSVAAAQDLSPRQHDSNLFAVLEMRAEAAAAAHLEGEHEPRAGGAGGRNQIRSCTCFGCSGIGGRAPQDLQQGRGQNRK
jgi:hypothetical protein